MTSLSLLLQELELSTASIEEIQGFPRDFNGSARSTRIPEPSWVSIQNLLCFDCTARLLLGEFVQTFMLSVL